MHGSRFEPNRHRNHRIVIGRADDLMIEDALDHELAHAVDHVRRPEPARMLYRAPLVKSRHDDVFYKTLLEVIRARGGNPTDHM